MTASQQAQQQLHQPPTEIPSEISSAQTKLVYFFIKSHNGTTIDEISDTLDLKKITLLSLLKRLTKAEHITKTDNRYY